jgi:hypothetical protein
MADCIKHNEYELIVGNIGLAHRGGSINVAVVRFNEYKRLSKANYGRIAGESVALFKNGELIREFIGSIERGENETL